MPELVIGAYRQPPSSRHQAHGAAMPQPADRPPAGPAAPPTCTTALAEIRTAAYDVRNVIGGREVATGRKMPIVTPHAHNVQLGQMHCASAENVYAAITSATAAAQWWSPLKCRSAPRRSHARPKCSNQHAD